MSDFIVSHLGLIYVLVVLAALWLLALIVVEQRWGLAPRDRDTLGIPLPTGWPVKAVIDPTVSPSATTRPEAPLSDAEIAAEMRRDFEAGQCQGR